MPKDSESMPIQQQPLPQQLPPPLEMLHQGLKADRRKLLKEEGWGESEQLKQFVGQFLYPRLSEMFQTLAQLALESYGLAASNTNELRRLHAFTVEELRDLGAELDRVEPPGVSPDTLNAFNEAFFALGTLLQEKYPEDKEVEAAYNLCSETVSEVVHALMESSQFDYDDSDEDDEDDSDSSDDDPKDDSGDDESADESSRESEDAERTDG